MALTAAVTAATQKRSISSDAIALFVVADDLDVLDLTTQREITDVEDSGITISERPYTFNFQVSIRKSLFEIGYEWLIEDYSCGGILQTNVLGPVFTEDDDDGS